MIFECPIRNNAVSYPDRTFLIDSRRSWNWLEFDRLLCELSVTLNQRGIKDGDRFAIIAENSVEYAALLFAAYRIGAVAVPLNLRRSRTDWDSIIGQANCRLIVYSETYAEYAQSCGIKSIDISEIETGSNERAESETITIEQNNEHLVISTSGSEGKPKGVILTTGNLFCNALGSNENILLQPQDCWLASLPFYHVGGVGILYRAAFAGASVSLIDRFDPVETNRIISDGTVTHISVVSTMLQKLIEIRQNKPFPETLKCILLGGGSLPHQLISDIIEMKAPVLTTYGLTEAASQVTTLSPDDPPEKRSTAGKPLKWSEIQIVDEHGRPLSEGQTGRIAIRGRVVFSGYTGETETRTRKLDDWFVTGDVGLIDSDGYLVVRGRADDMFISGGENVFPADIERVALQFSAVSDAAVISVDDATWGRRPVLFVCGMDKRGINMKELRAHLEINLSRILLPDMIIEIEQIPRTSIDKPDKTGLLDIYRAIERD